MTVERIIEILREEYQAAAKQDRQAGQAIGEILEKYPDTGRPLELSEEDKKERYWHLRDRHIASGRQQAVGNTIKKINEIITMHKNETNKASFLCFDFYLSLFQSILLSSTFPLEPFDFFSSYSANLPIF